MKTLKNLMLLLLTGCTMFFVACSDDDDDKDKDKPVTPPATKDVHYDIWVGLDQSKMGQFGTLLVQNVNSLEESKEIDFKNFGCNVTQTFGKTDAAIIKGKYYYQIDAVNEDRFVKFQIINNQLTCIHKQPFKKNTYTPGRYTHVWLDDNTFIIFAANGKADDVIWTKLNAETLEILAEGSLNLKGKTDVTKFTTSGLAAYRKSDNKIIYFFKHNPGRNKVAPPYFFAAFVDANSMNIEKIIKEDRAEEMAGTAYGELRQNKMFFDENENLYLACNTQIQGSESTTCQFGNLLRINKGETDFDKNYKGFDGKNSKIVTVNYLGNHKMLLYLQDPQHTGVSDDNSKKDGWGDKYNCYYAMYDINTNALTEFQYEGKNLPYNIGTFSQRSFVLDDKAFIGVNPKDSQPVIYIYNSKDNTVSKGISIQEGYEFSRINYIHN